MAGAFDHLSDNVNQANAQKVEAGEIKSAGGVATMHVEGWRMGAILRGMFRSAGLPFSTHSRRQLYHDYPKQGCRCTAVSHNHCRNGHGSRSKDQV